MPYPQEQHRTASKTLSTALQDKAQHIIGYVKLSQCQQGAGPFK